MNKFIEKDLTPDDAARFMSPYLTEGRKDESWVLGVIKIRGETLSASVSMSSVFRSPADGNQFHLTVFSTLEFLGQLLIIYNHVWAGLEEKTRECWMVESYVRTIRPIRDSENIQVEIVVPTIRKRGENLYSVSHSKVTDPAGGLFEVTIKSFVS